MIPAPKNAKLSQNVEVEENKESESKSSASSDDSSNSSNDNQNEAEAKVTPISFEKSTAVVKMEDQDEHIMCSQFSGRTFRIEPSEVLSNTFDGIENILRENFIKKCSKSENLGDIVDELLADIDRVKRKGSFINRTEIKLEHFKNII